MSRFDEVKVQLVRSPKTWLITGAAGFIGSNLLETLLALDQKVVGLDNFATGFRANLNEVKDSVSSQQWANFRFIEGDIRSLDTCKQALEQVDYVLHQAALGSVPRSINDPLMTNDVNINGFLNMLTAAKEQQVKSFTYAASSSTYGDHPDLPKVEDVIGNPLSPYAVTKYVNELYADVYAKVYGFKTIGLRYFNVFGKRQNPKGAYAAVIPNWMSALIHGNALVINGDGHTSRDFCFIENAVQANILAATATADATDEVYNVAVGDNTSLNDLFAIIQSALTDSGIECDQTPTYQDFRAGDVKHSQADISKIGRLLGYQPHYRVRQGVVKATAWYIKSLGHQ